MKKITKVITTTMFATSALAFTANASEFYADGEDVLGNVTVKTSTVKPKPQIFATGEVVKYYPAAKEARTKKDIAGLKAIEQKEVMTVTPAQLADMVANLTDDVRVLKRRKARLEHDLKAYTTLDEIYAQKKVSGEVGKFTTYASLKLGEELATKLNDSELKVKLDGEASNGTRISMPKRSSYYNASGLLADALGAEVKGKKQVTPTLEQSAEQYFSLKAQLNALRGEIKDLDAKEDEAYKKVEAMLSSISLHQFYADQYKKPVVANQEVKEEVVEETKIDEVDSSKGKDEEVK